jgi:hypothetical protein
MEVTMDKCVRGEKVLGLGSRFESLHLAFSTSCRPMRVFRAVVQISTLSMFNRRKKLALCHAITPQLISHDHTRQILKVLQEQPKKAFGRLGIPPLLDEDVEHDAVLIHGAPKIVLHSLDSYEHLIQVPLVAGPWPAAAQSPGKALSELLAPAPDGLIGDDYAPLGQKELNVSKADTEDVIQPDSMADDLDGKAMAVVRVGRVFHAASLAGLQPGCQTGLP